MSGKAILVVGARGTGKTTTNKKLLEKVHPDARLVLDVNGEYKDLYPYPPISFSEFGKKAMQVRDAYILIEEATIFLNNRGYNGDITDILVKARHHNNTIAFSFHSFNAIPNYIFELSNVVIIHKTNDNIDTIKALKNPVLEEAFLEINKADWLVNEETGKRYSPNKIVFLD